MKPPVLYTPDDLAALLARERERTSAVLAEWLEQHRQMYEAHARQQERMILSLLDEQTKESGLPPDLGQPLPSSPTPSSLPNEPLPSPSRAEIRAGRKGFKLDAEGAAGASREKMVRAVVEDLESVNRGKEILEHWKCCSGLQTVEKWVTNYRQHPGAWGALLMIQGIPEVTGRLRTKVENYGIYSALFLSISMPCLTDPPDWVVEDCEGEGWYFKKCMAEKRVYLWGLAVGTALHMLSILLGMAFTNALNEAARDSDVYRMFARGKGYLATVRCQRAFRWGCIADFVSMLVSMQLYIGLEAWPGTLVLVVVIMLMFCRTATPLFKSASLVRYWRKELGGKPDAEDPYSLQVPINHFKDRVQANRDFFLVPPGSSAADDLPLWKDVKRVRSMESNAPSESSHPTTHSAAGAVAAFF
mmetsp:Transcript_62281/g.144930  ORF Transcript_62281/g.144930 Transcript_62281/m.144930 type:complete len:416 (+) Transcript_62281:57-1304(+)